MTETDICNMALSHIGKGVIQNMEEERENARACKTYYDITRHEVLRSYAWGFAHRIERLALVAIELPGYAYAYAYPEKCIQLNQIRAKDPDRERVEPCIVINTGTSTKVIACDVKNAYADYVYDVKDVAIMDSLFIQAFSRLLAANISMRLLGNPEAYKMQYQVYQATLSQAQLHDAQEHRQEAVYLSNYAKARFGRK